jgi:dephospho-CoA kinase
MGERMLTVGLTGGICSGKSEVAAVLRDLGCRLFDADLIARQLLQPGTELFRQVLDRFGDGILDEDGAIHRPSLGRLVFSDPGKRRLLDRMVHPAVMAEEHRLLQDAERAAAGRSCIAVVEAALMVEAGSYTRYHKLVVVHCTVAQQIERLTSGRGMDRAEAEARVASQLPTDEKAVLAHYTVDASGGLEETRQRAVELHRLLVRDERERREAN